jgi:hypothetical protein
MAQCPKCGAELSPSAQYCGQCGVSVSATQSTETTSQPTSVSGIFTGSAYIVQTKISESYRSRAPRTKLGTFYQLSTFEIKERSGTLVARVRHMDEPLPTSLFNLSRLPSLRAYCMETRAGVRIGELRGPAMLIPNRPYLEIKDANGQEIASIIMKVERKPGGGFFSAALTTWVVAKPSGEELARINWGKTGRDWTIETPGGATIAQVQHLEEQESEYQTTYEVKILNPTIPPYLVLATFLATPPGTK